MWILDLAADVESDMHRFHGVWLDLDDDDFGGLDARRLITLVERLPAYDGAVAHRIRALLSDSGGPGPGQNTATAGVPVRAKPGDMVLPDPYGSSTEALENNPGLAGWVEVVRV